MITATVGRGPPRHVTVDSIRVDPSTSKICQISWGLVAAVCVYAVLLMVHDKILLKL